MNEMNTPSDLAKHGEAVEILRDLTKSFEYYVAKDKPQDKWDEYDHMMCPIWQRAAAYLASLPSDDNEPATVEWLETQGWINRGEYLEFNTENISLDFWPQYKLLKAQGSTLIDNPIRSAVRHLLAALTPLTPATGGEG